MRISSHVEVPGDLPLRECRCHQPFPFHPLGWTRLRLLISTEDEVKPKILKNLRCKRGFNLNVPLFVRCSPDRSLWAER